MLQRLGRNHGPGTSLVKAILFIMFPTLPLLFFLQIRYKANDTAVIICPGGGLYMLAFSHEGTGVAQLLARKGITAFVLRYRLAHVLAIIHPINNEHISKNFLMAC